MHTLLIILLALLFPIQQIQNNTKPNILFFFADDQRADTIAALGNKAIITPNLDKLVKAGTSMSVR